MAEIRVELRIGPTGVRLGLVALLLAAHAPDINPESVTLTTYYPSPSGVYFQMTTTESAYLATTGGNVGVGTTAPGSKLHVLGGGGISVTGSTSAFRAYGVGDPAAANTEFLQMHHTGTVGQIEVAAAGSGACRNLTFTLGGAERMRVMGGGSGAACSAPPATVGFVGIGVSNPTAQLQVGTLGSAGGIVKLGQMAGSCTPTQSTTGVSCGGGFYATSMTGVYANRWQLGYRPTNSQMAVDFLCCLCPAGGCSF